MGTRADRGRAGRVGVGALAAWGAAAGALVLAGGTARATAPQTTAIDVTLPDLPGLVDSTLGTGGRAAGARVVSDGGRYVVFEGQNLTSVETTANAIYRRDLETGTTVLVSVASDGGAPDSESKWPSISADGNLVAFESYATNLVSGDHNDDSDVFVRDIADGTTTRVSVTSGGAEAHGQSWGATIGADGTRVAFASSAGDLVAGDGNGQYDVFVHDLAGDRGTTRASVDADGGDANGDSAYPSLSADGRYVAFASYASDVGDDGDTLGDVFVRDLDASSPTTTRISVPDHSGSANGDSTAASISDDGAFVAFESSASDLVDDGDAAGTWDVFVRETCLAGGCEPSTERISVTPTDSNPDGGSQWPSISGDGSLVAFGSSATTLVDGHGGISDDVFLYNRDAHTMTRVSEKPGGGDASGESRFPSLASDGSALAFDSTAPDLVAGDGNGKEDVFVRDLADGTTTLASAADAAVSSGRSESPGSPRRQVSEDGRYVVFASAASNLVAGDTNSTVDVFLRDTQSGTTTRVSVDPDGIEADGRSGDPTISRDGEWVAFSSEASNLVADDTNGGEEIFLWHRTDRTTQLVSLVPAGLGSESAWSVNASVSDDGRYVAFDHCDYFYVEAGDDSDEWSECQLYRRDMDGGTIAVRVDENGDEDVAIDAEGYPSISGDGRYVAFQSSSGLVAGDTDGNSDVYVRDLDLQEDSTELVSVDDGVGEVWNGDASISKDGRFVAWDEGPVSGGTSEVFVRDTCVAAVGACTPEVERVSAAYGGGDADGASYFPVISDDGNRVVFSSEATNLVPGGNDDSTRRVFMRDLSSNSTSLAGIGIGGAALTEAADGGSISPEGGFVAFWSGTLWASDAGSIFLVELGHAPALSAATANGTTLTLAYSETLATVAPAASAFTVHAGGSTVGVSSVAISGSSVALTPTSAIAHGQTVTLDYAPPAAYPLSDGYGYGVAALAGQSVTNQTPAPAEPPPTTTATTTTTTTTTTHSEAGETPEEEAAESPEEEAAELATGTEVALPGTAGQITVLANGKTALVAWPAAGLASAGVTVTATMSPSVVAGGGFAVGSVALSVTVTAADGSAVTSFSAPLDLEFPDADPGVVPAHSSDGKVWEEIPALPGPWLPAGYDDGWYRDAAGVLHVLTLHATYFGLLAHESLVVPALTLSASTAATMRVGGSDRLKLKLRTTLPATVTVVLRRAGKTVRTWTYGVEAPRTVTLRVPERVCKPGLLRLAVTAVAPRAVAGRTLTVRVLAARGSRG